jgi:hypothetical protein
METTTTTTTTTTTITTTTTTTTTTHRGCSQREQVARLSLALWPVLGPGSPFFFSLAPCCDVVRSLRSPHVWERR